MAKGLRQGMKQSTHTRADIKLARVFMNLNRPKVVEADGKKRYTIIVRDNFHGIRGCTLRATNRTPLKRSSSFSRALVQMVSRHRW